MARPKSEFLKAMGTGWEIFQTIVNEVLSLGGNDEHLRRILTSKILRRQIGELIVEGGTKVVESTRTLATMIAEGKYGSVNDNITEANFPMSENLVLGLEPKLFHFGRIISSENVIREMEKEGYRPATIWDLLDYGIKNSEMQRQFPIVALCSVCRVGGDRYVACLNRIGSERNLSLIWVVRDWREVYRFLAVRK
jgi:hypothetical protein